MSWEQLLGYLPRLIVVVGIMYFMFNPLFKHQNTIDPWVLFFVLATLLTIWTNSVVMDVRLVVILCGVFAVVAVAGGLTLRFLGFRILLLLNVTHSDGLLVAAFLKDNAIALGLSETEVRFRSDRPWILVFRTKQHALTAKLAKETEMFIRNHVTRKFMPVWASLVVGLIFIAILWRF
ncbi:MAG TPA: hypothetical protein P5154_03525 [Candidatus Izemoplasmatales bacterium]|nr:hypothetical protein [Bacillota bacterium]HRY77812.1 hypothetical protein [Candidatus Izemoplasmatales bacterium]